VKNTPDVVRRWHRTAKESEQLIAENNRLMEKRIALYRQRVEVLRDLANAASVLVDCAHTHTHTHETDLSDCAPPEAPLPER